MTPAERAAYERGREDVARWLRHRVEVHSGSAPYTYLGGVYVGLVMALEAVEDGSYLGELADLPAPAETEGEQ